MIFLSCGVADSNQGVFMHWIRAEISTSGVSSVVVSVNVQILTSRAGKLDGTTMALRSEGFSEPGKQADRPMRLKLPVKFPALRFVMRSD